MKFKYMIAAVCMASFFVGCDKPNCGCKSKAASVELENVQVKVDNDALEGEVAEQ